MRRMKRLSHRRAARRVYRKFQQGITLLESLVAIVVLVLAVLATLGVQLRSLAETQTGVRRAQAVRLIEDLAERVKSNPDGFAQLAAFAGDFNASGAPGTSCDTSSCTPGELAKWDVRQWRAAVSETLPMGKAAIFTATGEVDPGTRRQLRIVVAWRANEYRRQGQDAKDIELYEKPLRVATGAAGIDCPADLICHLAHVQP
ncbi:type IV pilus assembly protein PilV [Variovorax sp. HW608]|uniref:type IV pilus modification protein PilV n=1 Tax=Variovorax sp. HW608 TaxID=1034889 RepID=UPI00081FC0F2|nr:type IV pilus modification protein PilV [Variovorax sp. HW608]SCK52535.1 type IV pilus assembly protein PilV [Variovorax sp. HW608]